MNCKSPVKKIQELGGIIIDNYIDIDIFNRQNSKEKKTLKN